MDSKNGIKITTRDRLLRAWENSIELVKDFEMYSEEIKEDEKAAKLFAELAEAEGLHASKLLELLHKYD
ncbi:MAG: rubrerythrin [Clostridia bacterium]|nr:rubrerythrin [Clostridia bacterium]